MRFSLTKRTAHVAMQRVKAIWPSETRPPAFLVSRRLFIEPGGDPIDWQSSKKATLQTNRELLGLTKPEDEPVWQNVQGICGPRFDKVSGTIKITSELYPYSAQNIKHVEEMMLDVLDEARRLAGLPKASYASVNPDEEQAKNLETAQALPRIIKKVEDAAKTFSHFPSKEEQTVVQSVNPETAAAVVDASASSVATAVVVDAPVDALAQTQPQVDAQPQN